MAKKIDYILGTVSIAAAYGCVGAATIAYGKTFVYRRASELCDTKNATLEQRAQKVKVFCSQKAEKHLERGTLYTRLATAGALLATTYFTRE